MSDDHTTVSGGDLGWLQPGRRGTSDIWMLVLVWSFEEPGRVGEVLPIPATGVHVFGRGGGKAEKGEHPLICFRQRPNALRPVAPLAGSRVSRRQLTVSSSGASLAIANVGRSAMRLNGAEVKQISARVGDVVEIDRQVMFLVARRPRVMPTLQALPPEGLHDFGAADAHGLVGESAAAWALRDELAFAAARQGHVLVLGESGVGKELAARWLHGLSSRRDRPMVARNAATFPEGLVDAELFGNVRDYPNPGMRERRGLVGEASGSTLFLDEIGELPTNLQAHLLRVMDSGGEYQRLGEARPSRADLRVVAATNRDPEALKHDFAARFKLRVAVPGLGERPEDIPLIARHLLRSIARDDPALGSRFFEGWDGKTGEPRIDPQLVTALLRASYTHHVRQLESFLWQAMAASPRGFLELTDELRAQMARSMPADHRDPADLTREEIRQCLERHDGNQSRAYRELGLSSRHALYRLIKKFGISLEGES